jgi:outer membrane usher protein
VRGRARTWLFLFAASAPITLLLPGRAAEAQTPEGEPPPASGTQPSRATPPAARIDDGEAVRLNPTGREIDLTVPLRDRFPIGQIAIRIMPDDQVLMSASDLATALARVANSSITDIVNAQAAPDGFVSLAALQQAGLAINYDPGQLELVLDLEATSRLTRGISLGFQYNRLPIQPDLSERFALAISYRAGLDYVHESNGGPTGLRSPRVDLDVNGRIGRLFSFENELTYDGDAPVEFVRRSSRVIYDRPEWSMRFTAGDQLPSQAGFQDAVEVLGIGAARLLTTFQPDRVVTAASSRTITLSEASNVTVVVNGIPTRTLRLEGGVYDLSDLPLTGGANEVELIVENDVGARRVVRFDFFEDFELLAPGLDEFDVQVGIRSEFEGFQRRYLENEPVFTGFYRRGISSQLTAGVNLQATERIQQVGFEGTLGTRIGLFTLETAFSNIDGFGFGNAQRFQYRYSTPLQQLQGQRRIDLGVEHRSRDFAGLETLNPSNQTAWRLTARYAQPITRLVSATIGADYAVNRDAVRDRYSVRASLNWSITPLTVLTASAGYVRRDGFIFGFNLIHRFGRSSTVTAQYDSAEDTASLTYNRTPFQTLDAVAISAQLTRGRDDFGFNGTATYRSNRGDLEIAHRATYDRDSNDITNQVTSLRARGSIAFAGGRIAIGRYLTDAFAIVSAHPSLGDAPVSAPIFVGDRLSGRTIARTGALGPALVPLSSYSHQRIVFEVPDAPNGYDLGAGNFTVYPYLSSGYQFVVGSEFNVTILGTLLDETGRPLPLLAGTARRVNDPDSPTVGVFTNRAGRFGASGLAPGQWRMTFAQGRYFDIEITESQGSLVNFGPIRPTGRQEQAQ